MLLIKSIFVLEKFHGKLDIFRITTPIDLKREQINELKL